MMIKLDKYALLALIISSVLLLTVSVYLFTSNENYKYNHYSGLTLSDNAEIIKEVENNDWRCPDSSYFIMYKLPRNEINQILANKPVWAKASWINGQIGFWIYSEFNAEGKEYCQLYGLDKDNNHLVLGIDKKKNIVYFEYSTF